MANKLSGYSFVVQSPLTEAIANGLANTPQDSDFLDLGSSRSDSADFSATTIDVTTKNSNQNQELLTERGIKSVSISMEGVLEDIDIAKNLEVNWGNQKLRWFRLKREDGVTWTGKFKIESYNFSGDHGGSQDFTMTLASSGEVTRVQP